MYSLEYKNKTNIELIDDKLKFLLNTQVGTIPIDRDFGVDMTYLDSITEEAKTKFSVEVLEKINKYIGIEIEEIKFNVKEGKLIPTLVVKNE